MSGGIVIPEILIKKEYRKENQTKTIKYIDLQKYHSKNKPTEESKKELYDENKNLFFTEFKSIRYAEIDPLKISGSKEYDESFFKQLDLIENNICDVGIHEKFNRQVIKFIKYCKIRNIINEGSIDQKYNAQYFNVTNNTNKLLSIVESLVFEKQNVNM